MSETIKSGQRYNITNEENGLAFDLSNSDNKSVLGWKHHGEERQRWIAERQDDGQWTIRSIKYQKYVGFEKTPKDGTLVVGLDRPHFWDIEILPDSEDHDHPRVKFWARGTHLVVEYPKDRPDPQPLRLWEARDGKNQVWVLLECS
ncbi:hypothetical protein EI94DRAFT_1738215 [Lactarius quietus]|nr:hypothetical protein EI94DRAFT_1738215 [Lactarius quietus]